ncbi:radical SAM superfamily protein [Mycobacterium kansasii 662]|uniref:Radical SAM superfamily protein n=1 Tax=Mycobacterium kansasii 662 TaxID=1299326 RepID=X7XQB2_MYCKA|nr:radical SAM protein [Mycobacterium kansasii]ETZ96354.1 radical SAM superfamily protein [Mycobacterium kansasii 662]
MQWVIKTTKLCNLRCKYCYEWEHLSDPTRMPEGVWRHALVAIRDYAELTTGRCGYDIPLDIIWHGGEPTLLPRTYLSAFLHFSGTSSLEIGSKTVGCGNVLQTNLYVVRDEHLDVFEEFGIELGVSVDFSGRRAIDGRGRPTEAAVRANMRRLQDRGLPFSIITVLAAHTISQIRQIFEEIARTQQTDAAAAIVQRPGDASDGWRHGRQVRHSRCDDGVF